MPSIYLSPSTQEFNFYVNGGTEEEYMNLIADAMEPYLRSSGITFTRNTPEMTAASSIRQSNEGNYDVHLALHSNAAPEGREGQVQGVEVYYYPNSTQGKILAETIAQSLMQIYPTPSNVKIVPTTSLGEVSRTRAPGVLIEYAYHDNEADANWIKDNIQEIAAYTVMALTQYFGIPFIPPRIPQEGVVSVRSGNLNIRNRPSVDSTVLTRAPNGAILTVYGRWEDWYVVEYNGVTGYASANYIQLY